MSALKFAERHNKEDWRDLVNSLPQKLKMTLTIKMNQSLIEKTEFFEDKPADVVAAISMHL